MNLRNIGITLGDPAGIGAEITAKALLNPSLRKLANFKIIGDECLFNRYFPVRYKNCEFVDLKSISSKDFKLGQLSPATGRAALNYLTYAVEQLKNKEIAALVTAPVSKEAIGHIVPSFHGHTEFLAESFGCKDFNVGMMFVSKTLRVLLMTRHIPLSEVSQAINKEEVVRAIQLTNTALKNYFKIRKPSIAVCGVNPHAGEAGTIGREEIDHIIPAIQKAKSGSINVKGPFPADTLFCPGVEKCFDAIIAMYHDQGLIPIKALYFRKLVNLTVGLPFIRTSPAHGTAFDIAGKNKADCSSMIEAVKLAVELTQYKKSQIEK